MVGPDGLVATSGCRGSFPTGVMAQVGGPEDETKRENCKVDCI